MNPVTFDWNIEIVNEKKAYGLIAQELEKVLPELVYDNGDFKSIKYIQIISFLINAVCELDTQIYNLKKGLDASP